MGAAGHPHPGEHPRVGQVAVAPAYRQPAAVPPPLLIMCFKFSYGVEPVPVRRVHPQRERTSDIVQRQLVAVHIDRPNSTTHKTTLARLGASKINATMRQKFH